LFQGKGAFGAVYVGSLNRGSSLDPVKVAVKVLRTHTPVGDLDEEHAIRTKLGYPCLPVLYEGKHIVAVCLPFWGQGMLNMKRETAPMVRRIPAAARMIRDVARCLLSAHDAGFLHTDICLGNICCSDAPTGSRSKGYRFHLVDWGKAEAVSNDRGTFDSLF